MNELVVAVVGLGYVGLPLAVEFGKKYQTHGFDVSQTKVESYKVYHDPTGELSELDLRAASRLSFSTDPSSIAMADVIIVAVPTPVDRTCAPDFSQLVSASSIVGQHMKKGATVVYESTVYPGATEEICIPVLEKHSGLEWKSGFHIGYSPERVNPGDKEHSLTKIVKVVAGDDENTLRKLSDLYASVITAGVYRVSSIKIAEAAKVIENTQRDVNIALMNEFSLIFHRLGIDTQEVLEAAKTKWNFLPFNPGLVGGHCIGVDPYYLTHKAKMLGYHSQVILAGRQINDSMAAYVADQTLKQMMENGCPAQGSKVIVLGLTFKANCADLRNSKIIDVVETLQAFGCEVFAHDPLANAADASCEYEIDLMAWDELPVQVDALIVAVTHQNYLEMPLTTILGRLKPGGAFLDLQSAYSATLVQELGYSVWRL